MLTELQKNQLEKNTQFRQMVKTTLARVMMEVLHERVEELSFGSEQEKIESAGVLQYAQVKMHISRLEFASKVIENMPKYTDQASLLVASSIIEEVSDIPDNATPEEIAMIQAITEVVEGYIKILINAPDSPPLYDPDTNPDALPIELYQSQFETVLYALIKDSVSALSKFNVHTILFGI